jgi:hypothetical protein
MTEANYGSLLRRALLCTKTWLKETNNRISSALASRLLYRGSKQMIFWNLLR